MLANIILLNETPNKFFLEFLMPNTENKTFYNYIYDLLTFNNL